MRRALWIFLVPLLAGFGCRRPDVEAFQQHPAPVTVSVSLPERVPDREAYQKEYAAALRARLATRLVVVPEGVTPPPGAVQLQVVIRDLSPGPSSPSAAAVGTATGVAVGLLSAASGHRDEAFFDGLFWGLWAGSNVAAERDGTEYRLGYRPTRIRADASLIQPGNPEPLWVVRIDPYEVVQAMDPLPPGAREDDGRILEEEARGFARVVVQRLSEDLQLLRVTEQRFYAPTPAPEAAPRKD